ncbi:hypothetical protein [Vibrio parahaemolyticus]|uniref:hypothetical protein n=1 Tax=Vibrio parahaemolyticus TaxID=670 RepID=UPI0005444B04|nr:hypothetical protein [Vibrio parahaemolyticus]KHF13482.1 hypothetical protein PO80_16035 [Vibrio parahaemolyticus]MBE3885349.1 hypothetical protein [Vibrio parahaemolyticus]OTV96576.1 hypothetical protein BA739_23070 [Vibrio parahaemolyticus]OTW00928.1 hypothetical protein BA740_23155 [Vibrio parahaemolyticus]TNY61624.1 hypothetical protein CGK67_08745 [Vibrio parahaemolyticus]
MHLVCKFIPSSKLSSNELSYVLTPDECIGQLSRVRNSEDILRNLPKELAQKISISAKKSSSGLLTAIRHELGNGNWVALSSFSRRTPLTDTQLQSFPRLKAQLESVSSTGESKVYKAGYKQVKDDVTLVRSYTHVPSEPSPDQKIVVEFAGQWSSNAACLMLGKTEAQKEKVTVGKADTENKHRSLATFKDLEAEGKTLYIKIPCSDQPQPILLKLAEDLQPVDKETQMDEWDNVLVPVRPLAYLDGSNDKAKASDLRGGFLYVFWKGKLWREMAIDEKGYYQDVDVEYYRTLEQEEKKKDTPQVIQRSASGFAMAHFWAPYKISGEVQQGESGLKIIFSPKQKRFAQIEALESDAALLEKSSTPLDELSSYSDGQSFSAQEFTSDVDSAAIHKVTEDDMPWLSDQQAIVRSYDQSNTVIAYVDGKNSGLLFRVDVGTSGITALNSLYVIDHNSDYKDVFDLEFYEGEDHDWQQALLSGLPLDGVFTMSLVHDQDPDSRHILFDRVAYNDLFVEPESATETPPKALPNDKPKGMTTGEKQRFESLVLDWSL